MKKMNQRTKEKLLLTSLAVGVLALLISFFIPLPYYIEMPGGATNVAEVMSVNGEEDQASGSYNFTYIKMAKATVPGLVYAWLTPFTDIYSEKEVTGGATNDEFTRINDFYMSSSQNMAEYQALTLAGEDIKMDYLGVYVLQVTDNSTFKDILKIADTVTAVNGETFESSAELIDYVSGLKLDDTVAVTYESDGVSNTENGKIIKLDNGKNGIGILLTDHTEVSSNHEVNFSTAGIGGPSAGLMFTLSIYTQIADPDLRGGRMIAGSGTIEKDGRVGDIGGIDKKVVSAANSGAEIFFAPNNPVDKAVLKEDPEAQSNYEIALETAKAIKTDMKIVPVKTAQEAIDYLEKN